MRDARSPIFSPLLLLGSLLWAGCAVESETPATAVLPQVRPAERIRGVTLDARQDPGPETLLRLRDMGVTHLAVIPMGFQERPDAPEIRHNPNGNWYSESDRGIKALAAQADSLGLQLILKPQIWTRDGGPAEVFFSSEEAWRIWEADYRGLVLHHARLAEEIDAPLLCIGTELARVARERPAFWRGLINSVRAVYDGKLTYAANWYGEYEHITFWDELDYIGVQAYFPISTEAEPSPTVLAEGWEQRRREIQTLQRRFGKPVLFTEIGYRSVPSAAAEPWRWPERGEREAVAPDFPLQADLYQAFFNAMWQQEGFAGAIIWKWYPHTETPNDRHTLDFTPQDKPAEQVIARWFREGSTLN